MSRRFNDSPLQASLTRRSFLHTSALVAGTAAVAGPFAGSVRAQEDGLVWYSGSSARSVEAWARMFQEETGVSTEFFRSGGVKLAQKFEVEVQAGSVMDPSGARPAVLRGAAARQRL